MVGWLIALTQLLGLVTAVRAVMEARTPQGAVAWAVALISFPYVALPLFWVFGKSRFQGYVIARRNDLTEASPLFHAAYQALVDRDLRVSTDYTKQLPFERLAKLPFTTGNDAELLIDGDATFASIFAGFEKARQYVLVQFYILRDDRVGRELRDRLVERAHAAVRVYVLYDQIGSYGLSKSYLNSLRDAGIRVAPFEALRTPLNPFQLNFRNHRKIVVVDGRSAWVGGLNIGAEYLSYRDTHLRVEGPVVQEVQVPFIEDWHWATGELPDLNWDPQPAANGARRAILCLPSGPADELETCTLFFIAAITEARRRLWIASPYFVPDEQFITALQLAALRGVEVRILVPEKSDNPLMNLSIWSYLDALEVAGIEVYRYQRGFMHQKVTLIDDDYCTIGTANFDNRSFRLNFEVTMGVVDKKLATEVREMLENDFAGARRVTAAELHKRSFAFRLAVRAARLTAPVQ